MIKNCSKVVKILLLKQFFFFKMFDINWIYDIIALKYDNK